MSKEKSLDRALHAALESDEVFRPWFLGQLARGAGYSRLVFCRSNHPWGKVRLILPNPGTGALEVVDKEGETDVLAVFENLSGGRIGIHIENKLANGSFTPYQPELYAARAEGWVGQEKHGFYQQWETVLVAPSAFIERNVVDARKFTSRITHEQVARLIPAFALGSDA